MIGISLIQVGMDDRRGREPLRILKKSHGRFVVCDFVCPTRATRENFDTDFVVLIDTVKEGLFEHTNRIFQKPEKVNFNVTFWNDDNHNYVAERIFQWKK